MSSNHTLMTEDNFREAAKAGKAPADARLRKAFIADVKAVDDNARAIDFTISTASVDRMGDTIAVDGWQLANFRKNPVVLWAHDSEKLPVAKASNVRVEDGKLKARAEFMGGDISGFADAVYRAIKGGFLSATSVGFAPLKYSFVDDPARRMGIDFQEQELLEFSIVPVPANAEALIEARAAGIDIAPIREWAEKMFAADDIVTLPRAKFDSIMALPTKFRDIAKSLPDGAKGARGQLLRCANIAEREIKAEVPETGAAPDAHEAKTGDGKDGDSVTIVLDGVVFETSEVEQPKSTPVLDMARRRLELHKRKIA